MRDGKNAENLVGRERKYRKYNLKLVPENFLLSDQSQTALVKVIERLEQNIQMREEIDNLYDDLCDLIVKEMNNVIPFKDCKEGKRFKSHKPYWNEELSVLWKKLVTSRKNYDKCKSTSTGREIRNKLQEYKLTRKAFDRQLRREERRYRRGLMEEIESVQSNNPTVFWDHVNKLGPKRKSKIPLEIYDGEGNVDGDLENVLKKWESEYSKLYTGPDKDFNVEWYNTCMIDKMVYEESMNDPLYTSNESLNDVFSITELDKIITNCKNGKATGIDRIPNEVLKNKNVKALLLLLFNACFLNDIVPHKWLQAIVYPIPKDCKNDPRVPLHYRGISLLSTVSKVYTGLMNLRLQCYMEKDILVDEQNGFRKKRSCQDHLYTLTSIVRNRKNKNLSTYAAFIDMKKAFDFVNRDLLLYKLLKNNIDGHMYNAIKALYQNTSACVQINEHFTNWFPTLCGVRQGDNLSPTLFSLFLNDLAVELKSLNSGVKVGNTGICILLYADDIVLLSDSEEKLQALLNHLNTWCNKWQLVINSDKSKIVHFRKRVREQSSFEFKVGSQQLHIVNEYKYLGVKLNEFLDVDKMCESLAVGGGRALGSINSKFRTIKNMGIVTYSKLFDNCVMPVLHYCAGVWGLQKCDSLQHVQNRAMRFYLGVHKFAPTLGMLGDLGWYPLELYRKIDVIRYWNRLVNMPNHRLTKKMFMFEMENCNNNWCSDVRKILYNNEFAETFDNVQICNIKELSDTLKRNFADDWLLKMQGKLKLRTYKEFKLTFGTENYIKMNLARSERSYISQIRLGILPIRIETGRFTRLEEEQRICEMCNTGEIENENHFLHHCSKYVREREELYNVAQQLNNNFNILHDNAKNVFLFNNLSRQVGKYIKKSYNLRYLTLNN